MSFLKKIIFFSFLILSILGDFGVARAAFNEKINYQGKLTNPNGVAVSNGTYNIRFRLCTASDCTGGADPIWIETLCYSPDSGTTCNGAGTDQRVSVSNGLFSVLAGGVSSLASVNFNQTLYLEVQIGGAGATPAWETLTPRKALGAVPAAFEAKKLGGATWAAPDAIGSGTPAGGAFTTLSSTGLTTVGNNSATVEINSSVWDISTLGAMTGITGISSSGDIDFSSLSVGGLIKAAATTGRLSIATAGTDFENPLTFSNGLIRTTNSVKLGGTLTAATDIPLGGYDFTFSGTGNVGIGTATPQAKLDANGQLLLSGGVTGTAPTPQLKFGNYYDNDATPSASHILLYDGGASGSYGFGINAGVLNIITDIDTNFIEDVGGTMTSRMIIKSGGNVGIGDTTPDGLLDVEPTGAVTAASYGINLSNLTTNVTTNGINKYGAYITSTGAFTGSTGTATNNYGLYVDTVSGADNNYGAYFADNVGIGSSSPVLPLMIFKDGYNLSGNLYLVSASNNTAGNKGINLGYDSSGTIGTISPGGTTSQIAFWTHNGSAWGEKVRIDASGNVGIGLTNSASKLAIADASSGAPSFSITTPGTGAAHQGMIWLATKDANGNGQFDTGDKGVFIGARGDAYAATAQQNDLIFYNYNSAWSGVLFDLDASGNIGIGTDAPTNLLSLSGTAARTIWMERNTTAATAGQGLTLSSGGAIAGTANLVGGDLTLKSGISTGTGSSAMRFFTATAGTTGTTDNAPTEKMTILGSGYVGIGTTSPAGLVHASDTAGMNFMAERVLDGSAPSALYFRKANGTLPASRTGVLVDERIGAIVAQGYYGTEGSGGAYGLSTSGIFFHASENYTSTAQGSYITFGTAVNGTTTRLERMRISSAGNVGIGNAGLLEKLQVTGNVYLDQASSRLGIGIQALTRTGIYATPTFTDSATNVYGMNINSTVNNSNALYQGYRAYNTVGAGATITNNTGFHVVNPAGSGAITTNYGLYVEEMTKGSTNYAIYSAGPSDKSYFGGSVGIGDTTPDGLLDIESTGAKTTANYGINLSNLATSSTASINKYGAYISSTGTWNGASANNYGLYVDTPTGGTNNYAAIFAGGNVGIGTTSPVQLLYVQKDQNAGTYSILRNATAGTGAYEAFRLTEDDSNKSLDFFHINTSYTTNGILTANTSYVDSLDSGGLVISSRDAAGVIKFATGGLAATNERMRINSSGNVIIGDGTAYGDSRLVIAGTNGNDDASITMVKRDGTTNPVMSLLAWDSDVYMSAGTYISNGTWVHNSDDTNSEIFNMSPGYGVNWFASSDSSATWNVASSVNLWDNSGYWKSLVQSTATGNSYFTGGNIGIGDTTPDGLLDVESTGAKTAANYGINLSNLATSSTASINKYGAYISSTGTWNGASANNYGLYVDTPTGGTNNYAAVFAGGNVGIGTASPDAKLNVASGQISFGAISTNALFNISTAFTGATNASGLRLVSALTPTTGNSVYGLNIAPTAGSSTENIADAATILVTPPGKGNSGTLTNLYGVKIATSASTSTNAYGLYVDAPTGGTNNYAAVFAGGNVGIGTASPNAILDLANNGVLRIQGGATPSYPTSGSGIQITYDSDYTGLGGTGVGLVQVYDNTGAAWKDMYIRGLNTKIDANGTTAVFIKSDGNVGIGLTGPTYLLQLSTDSAGKPNGGSWANSSDMRLKTNIEQIAGELALNKILQLQGVSFEWINPEDHGNMIGAQGGFIAQEVEKVFPKWISEINPGGKDIALVGEGEKIKSLSLPFEYDAYMVEAIKEQQKQIEELKLALNKNGNIIDSNGEAIIAFFGQSQSFKDMVASAVKDALSSITGTVIAAGEWTFDKITAKQICIEDVCVDKNQLQELLDKNNAAPEPLIPNSIFEMTPEITPISSIQPLAEVMNSAATPSPSPMPEIILTPNATPEAIPEITPISSIEPAP